ncbi:ATP12 family chaperone protein [Algirhabdus cladophorae]|uniref:ATP12 family chaperone protein n=1 Tax=Algirhabdus cladophorae TaxID=3377108 RepID=UPI003B848556
MSDWKQKRFWTSASTTRTDAGFGILLDDRAIKTPAKAGLIVPTQSMAAEIAAEWDAQETTIDPGSMPITRAANAAIDKVQHQRAAVADMLSEYGGTDLLCYRANSPVELAQRQSEGWDPLLSWSAQTLSAPLNTGQGVMHIDQPAESLTTLAKRVHQFDPFELTGFHDLVALSGSLILAFAVVEDHITAQSAWDLSRIDETWQIEQWGHDEEAESMAQTKQLAFFDAQRFLNLLKE